LYFSTRKEDIMTTQQGTELASQETLLAELEARLAAGKGKEISASEYRSILSGFQRWNDTNKELADRAKIFLRNARTFVEEELEKELLKEES
jgi:hypothetical protein